MCLLLQEPAYDLKKKMIMSKKRLSLPSLPEPYVRGDNINLPILTSLCMGEALLHNGV